MSASLISSNLSVDSLRGGYSKEPSFENTVPPMLQPATRRYVALGKMESAKEAASLDLSLSTGACRFVGRPKDTSVIPN